MKNTHQPDSNNNRKKNTGVVGIIIVVIVVLIGLGLYSQHKRQVTNQTSPPANINSGNPTANQTMLPQPKAISNFSLTDDHGKPFTNENLKGHWTIAAFGFSHCGDVCPITLTELNKMYQKLHSSLAENQMPQVLFISVDPQRDTTAVLHRYIKNYNPNFIAATGDSDNLNIFVKEMGVFFSKKPSADPNVYGMEHSSQIFLFNPQGEWVGLLNFPFQSDKLATAYEALIHGQTA
ncbi:MAG: SCO family protein [Proteobacteria bacterium]|nr:SCO family protein [Pseudomonadota bacterium]